MSRIAATFDTLSQNNRKALITFITAGDPEPAMTVLLMHELVNVGADIIELGVPFSDPMADGPTIQRSYERALKYHVGLKDVLEMVAEFRRTNTVTPVVLMGYANPVEAMGHRKFVVRAKECGVDGVLTVDYPPEECEEWIENLKQEKIDAIFLFSPTTSLIRIQQVAKRVQGFVYYVSLKGVTGAAHINLAEVANKLAELRSYISIPVGVGFGIHDGVTARAVAEFADAVVVGSRIIEEIEKSAKEEVLINVSRLVKSLRSAIDKVGIKHRTARIKR
ncbi:MAG: tryptophan synthase subunit alpha [Nitrosomonadaceae bacterium]